MLLPALSDTVGVVLGVSGLVVAGALFVFRAGTVLDELAGEYDRVRRLRDTHEALLRWTVRAVGFVLVLVGVSFGYIVLRPAAPLAPVFWNVLVLCSLVFLAAGAVAMILRPRAFVVGMNPTLELVDSYLPDGWTDRVVRVFGALALLSSLLFLYLLFL
jgi:hypothetical protein